MEYVSPITMTPSVLDLILKLNEFINAFNRSEKFCMTEEDIKELTLATLPKLDIKAENVMNVDDVEHLFNNSLEYPFNTTTTDGYLTNEDIKHIVFSSAGKE